MPRYVPSVSVALDIRLLYQDTTTTAFVMPWKVFMLCTRQYGFLPDMNPILFLDPLSDSALA